MITKHIIQKSLFHIFYNRLPGEIAITPELLQKFSDSVRTNVEPMF